jgi:anti-sigma regulatory factor (Ser/Thr protein kinase)
MPGDRTEEARYPRHRASIPAARHHARKLAQAWDVPQLADDLELVVSELVTNAVEHGITANDRRVAVAYHITASRLRVEVRDAGDGTPAVHDNPPAEAENGRGLLIVGAVADAWGVIPCVVGKTTWAEWHLAERRTPSEAIEVTAC